jgi:hypothetical protein
MEEQFMMIRNTIISLAAAALVLAGSTLTADARFGGGMGHGGGFARMGGFGASHFGGFSRSAFGPGFARPGGFSRFGAFPLRANRFAFRHHRFFGPRFAFVGAAFPYAYDDCYRRVWTPIGWRWTYACYY